MRSRARGLGANASLALAGDVIAKGGMFVALLLLAHALSVEEFARLGVAMAAMLIVTSLLDGGVGVIATREGAADPSQRRGLLRAGLAARLPLLAASFLLCLLAGALLGELELSLIVFVTAVVNAAQLALFALFRSAQTLVNEAAAKGFCGLSYPLLCAAAAASGHRSASAALLAMVVGPLLTLPPLLISARAVCAASQRRLSPRTLLRRAVPFGLIALATLVYYRAPMLLMGLLSTPAQTGAYSVAANIAFGLLMLPAAFATGLLPRLSGERDPAQRKRLIRNTLLWSTGVLAAVELVLAASASQLVPLLYGRSYRGAVDPLLILLASGLAIGIAGIIGTALIADDRPRGLVAQVVAAVAVNLAASAALIPPYGADGAALATLLTEAVSLGVLVSAYRSPAGRGSRVAPARAHKAALVP